jgi:two-component system CheB/CheR fusion protein
MAAKKRMIRRADALGKAKPGSGCAADPMRVSPAMPEAAAREGSAPKRTVPPVAGIGASAGGLAAFTKLISAMPADSGVALVLVPHLDPTHESLMVRLLARHTTMPVVAVEDEMVVEANHVYIIPPNKYMSIRDGVLRLTGPVDRRASQTSIDRFFRSLAADSAERSICIILSGTGSHGALGLKAVKAAGGMGMVQDPATAEYTSMPQSAIATGLVDFVLPVDQMPQALCRYIRHDYVKGRKTGAARTAAPDELDEVLALVRARTQLDFGPYAKKTLARRVQRRMSLNQFDCIADYRAFLGKRPSEVRHLSRDLLISVTSFFHDPEAWRELETAVITPLVRAKEPGAPVRVWSVGCATGEEPYSVGMLLLEQLAAAGKHCAVQIFATDVDEGAIDVARQAIYSESISADVAPDRLARFFTRVGDSFYQVNKQLRETVIFARQNLICDAPISKLDLVVCRNLLIYLEPEVQKKAIGLLHFVLVEGGFLFLGRSEPIGTNTGLFEPISPKRWTYRRQGPTRVDNLPFPVVKPKPLQARSERANWLQPPLKVAEAARNSLLRRYALSSVVIDRDYQVLHFAGRAEDYLIQPAGTPERNLLALARPSIESRLRVTIQRSINQNTPQSAQAVVVRRAGLPRRVNIDVAPLDQSPETEGLLLVSFQEQPCPAGELLEGAKARTHAAAPDLVHQLQQQLRTTREDLQGTIEQLESANEGLKASNEEVSSMNQELRSANVELELSTKQLQSVNEKLTVVNAQLQESVRNLEAANNDMANLFNCTGIATVFLDSALRIKRFTPACTRLFNLSAIDLGRPIGGIVKRFTDRDLVRDAQRVVGDLEPREQEVRTEDGCWYARRIVPYRTLDDRVDGVVMTFVDITERKQDADAVVGRLAAVVESCADAIVSNDLDGAIRTWNRGAERLYGYSPDEAVGRSIEMLLPDDHSGEWTHFLRQLARGEHIEHLETEHLHKDGRRLTVALTISPIRDGSGKVVSASSIARDISERKHAEEALRHREALLQAILNAAADSVITTDRAGVMQSVNPATERMFGYAAAEMVGQNVSMLMSTHYGQEHDGYMARYLETGESRIIGISREMPARRKDGTIFPTELAVSEIKHLGLFTGIHRDLSERKRLEREVVEAASMEQRRIGQDLHDSVAQELTALNLLARDLAETFRTEPARAEHLLGRIAEGLQRSHQGLRRVLRGLLPVAVDSAGLMAALADLADRTEREGKVMCTLECPIPVAVEDNLIATHLYLIAQEAVHNAVKHARPRSVRISLQSNHSLVLSVECDGIGMRISPAANQGLGLRAMRNRAAIIGATLTIEPARPSGTVVTCVLPRRNNEPTSAQAASPRAHRR